MPIFKDNTLTDRDVAKIIASMNSMSRHDAEKQIANVFSGIVECIRNGYNVTLYGFGKFTIYDTEPCEKICLRDKTMRAVPKRRYIRFKMSRNLILKLQDEFIEKNDDDAKQ